MNYIDVYRLRMNHMGETTGERIRNNGIRSFYKWLDESPHTVRQLSVERGLYFDGLILTNKDKEYEKIMFLNVANDIPLCVGDIMNWELEDGSIQKWLLIQEEKKVNGTYRTFWIVRCNYLMKWVDAQGHVQQSWSYFVSSLDSKIKGNFRTWNSLITPQPNKYAQLLMPRYPIERSTNFIVEDESWTVVEYDHTSVPGVIYLSLAEGKINSIYDNVSNDLADTDKIAIYELLVPNDIQSFRIGEEISPNFTLTKNGVPYFAEVEYIPTDKSITKIINGKLMAVGGGTTEIIIQLKDYPSIQKKLTIQVGTTAANFIGYIEGIDKIKLDRIAEYKLTGTNDVQGAVSFTLNNQQLATITSVRDNYCVIRANNKNKLGSIMLSAQYNGETYTKAIQIIPLW